MKTIHEITKENFDSMFNLKDILEESVYYPASGIDGTAIECLSDQFCSFIHADYSIPRHAVEDGMRNQFAGVGYDLIGIKYISREELTPDGFRPFNFTFNEHEYKRLQDDFISDRFYCRDFEPFALWSIYELNPSKTGKTKGKAKRYSLLHIGGEACATFEAIYLQNRINPKAVVIKYPGDGYGDNWTVFKDPSFRFYQNLVLNAQQNGADMPKVVLTSEANSEEDFWQDYKYKTKYSYDRCIREFVRRESVISQSQQQ